ncbi:hypothetical protein ACO0QE_001922 [Hanseniaspora vineae]
MSALSNLEHNATKHIRGFLKSHKTEHITVFGYIISLISCLSAGSVMIISLYSLTWLTKYHYTPLQANLISSAINIGGYLTPPLLGLLCDSHGPVVLSMTSIVTYVPHYYILSRSNSETDFRLIFYCFFMIGIGTSALFFSALMSCSKFYPQSKLLSISLPTTSYGISSIWLGYLVTHMDYFKIKEKLQSFENYLNLSHVYFFFSCFYLLIGVFDWIAASIVSRLKHELFHGGNKLKKPLQSHQESSQHQNYSSLENSSETLHNETEQEPLRPTKTNIKGMMLSFYKDSSAYLLLLVMFVSIGSMEMYITNMGTITELYDHDVVSIVAKSESNYDPQKTLATFSVNSTAIRIVIGLVIDFFTRKLGFKNVEITIMFLLLLLGFCSQLLMLTSNRYLALATSMMGMTYGGLFTTFPVVVLSHWGSEIFGTAYGSCMVAPALGSTTFGIVFARIFQNNSCSVVDDSCSFRCIGQMFQINAISFIFALAVATFIYFGMWRRKTKQTVHV